MHPQKRFILRPTVLPQNRNSRGQEGQSVEGDAQSNDIPPPTRQQGVRTKSRQLNIVKELRKKETGWDSRFVLEQIPNYNPLADRHCESSPCRSQNLTDVP